MGGSELGTAACAREATGPSSSCMSLRKRARSRGVLLVARHYDRTIHTGRERSDRRALRSDDAQGPAVWLRRAYLGRSSNFRVWSAYGSRSIPPRKVSIALTTSPKAVTQTQIFAVQLLMAVAP